MLLQKTFSNFITAISLILFFGFGLFLGFGPSKMFGNLNNSIKK
jgi:hypothetical protein